MNANHRNKLMAGTIFFFGLLIATTAAASPNIDRGAAWLRGEDLQLAQADVEASVEISTSPEDDARLEALERDLRVHVWHGREDDDPYSKGEALDLRFRTNADAYVVVYRIDAEGYVEVLWPSSRYDDGFAYGGHSYRLPPANSGQRLRVSNEKGVEYIQAIASEYPFDLRDLGIDFAFDPEERGANHYVVAGDPFLAVNEINYAITGLEEDEDYIVTDWTHLYVESKVDYARYSCNQCHVDDDDYHAYVDTCSQVTIRYDFGWYDRWYLRYGWYPIYYDPLYVYWDSYYYRPYYNWYYPVYYRWPSYYSSVYYRPYRVYYWWETDYYRGDHRRRYRDRVTRVRPLYPDRGASVKDRVRDLARRDTDPGDRVVRRGIKDRLRDGAPPPDNVRSRIRTARAEQRQTILNTERSARRLDRGGRLDRNLTRSRRDGLRDRFVSQSPDGKSRDRQRIGSEDRRGRDGRRWTKPVVRNTDRNDDRRRTLRSRGRSDDQRRDRADLRNRDRKGSDRKNRIRSEDRRRNPRRDDKDTPRVRSRDRKPAPRKDSKAAPRVKRGRKGKGDDSAGGAARVSRDRKNTSRQSRGTDVKRSSPRSSRPSRGATVKRSGSSGRGKGSGDRPSSSRSNLRSRDRSGSKGSASKPSSSRPSRGSSGKKGRSGRGGRG